MNVKVLHDFLPEILHSEDFAFIFILVHISKSYVASFLSYHIHKLAFPRHPVGDDNTPSAFYS